MSALPIPNHLSSPILVSDVQDLVKEVKVSDYYAPFEKHVFANELLVHCVLGTEQDRDDLIFAIAEEECDIDAIDGDQSFPAQRFKLEVIYDRLSVTVGLRLAEQLYSIGVPCDSKPSKAHVTDAGTLYVEYL